MKNLNPELSDIVKQNYDPQISKFLKDNFSKKSEEISKTKKFLKKVLQEYISEERPFITTKEFNSTVATTLSVLEGENYESWQIKEKITNNQAFKEYIKKQDLSKIVGKEKADKYMNEHETNSKFKIIYKNENNVKKYFK